MREKTWTTICGYATMLILLAGAFIIAPGAAWAVKPVNTSGVFVKKAIKGYDPVAYFTDSKPVEGKSEHTAEWMGATWYFASAEHQKLFEQNPKKYAPQYGGYCAYAVSQNVTADIDPQAWSIVDGKLYLNLNPDIQDRWEQDIPGYIAKANQNWPQLREQ